MVPESIVLPTCHFNIQVEVNSYGTSVGADMLNQPLKMSTLRNTSCKIRLEYSAGLTAFFITEQSKLSAFLILRQ